MIDKILLSEMKLRKKTINNDKNSSEAEENNYLINEEQKLINYCHFDQSDFSHRLRKLHNVLEVFNNPKNFNMMSIAIDMIIQYKNNESI